MPVIRVDVPQVEYDLIKCRARTEGKSIEAVVRDALRAQLRMDTVNPDDPVFHMFKGGSAKGGARWDSRDHDEILYPAKE